MNIFGKIINHFRELPEKKRYLEFFTALLSIPVLLSVIFMNYRSIQSTDKADDKEKTPTVITIVQEKDDEEKPTRTPTPEEENECRPEVGDVEISAPEEGETIESNPLSIIVDQNDPDSEYCAVVWSYRINNSQWSNYDDKDISIYNLDSGSKTLEVRVKSLMSGKEKTLKRTFTYKNTQEVPSPTYTSTPSPTTAISQ